MAADTTQNKDRGGHFNTRAGPRPLALHLANAVVANLGAAALPWMIARSKDSLPELPVTAELLGQMRRVGPISCQKAVIDLGLERLEQFLAGVRRYQSWPEVPRRPDQPVMASLGSVRLLEFAERGQPLLVIPSLINPAHILDLMDGHSLMARLSEAGFRPLIVDWGAAEDEATFDVGDYITARLEPLTEALIDKTGQIPIAIGYCMGGVLATALAARKQVPLAGLALLATPWDFHAGEGARTAAMASRQLLPIIRLLGRVPPDLMAAFFAALDPTLVERKFRTFAAMPEASERARLFVAVEDWVNAGPPLAGPVAVECLEQWYLENRTAAEIWSVGGTEVRPSRLQIRSLVAIPDRDRIVPPASAQRLAEKLRNVSVIRPQSGHIGMIVGRTSQTGLWDPLCAWLKAA